MNITDWKEISEIGKNAVTVGAMVIGGWWSYIRFFKEAEHESSINVKVACDIVETDIPNIRLLSIKAELCNNGRTPSQIICEKSRVDVYKINPSVQTRELYVSCDYFKTRGSFNIPVKGTMEVLDFALIDHPGIYHVRVFFTQSTKDSKKFYRRMSYIWGKRIAYGGISGWTNESVISSEITSS